MKNLSMYRVQGTFDKKPFSAKVPASSELEAKNKVMRAIKFTSVERIGPKKAFDIEDFFGGIFK